MPSSSKTAKRKTTKKAVAGSSRTGGGRRRSTKTASAGVEFTLTLPAEGPRGTWCPVVLPKRVHEALGGDRGRIPVVGTADGYRIRTSASPMGGKHLFPFNKQMQKATGKGPGDRVRFALERDNAKRTVEVPPDLAKALRERAALKKAFDVLSYSCQKEYVQWIEEAKRPETRERRIAKTVEMVREGRKLK